MGNLYCQAWECLAIEDCWAQPRVLRGRVGQVVWARAAQTVDDFHLVATTVLSFEVTLYGFMAFIYMQSIYGLNMGKL